MRKFLKNKKTLSSQDVLIVLFYCYLCFTLVHELEFIINFMYKKNTAEIDVHCMCLQAANWEPEQTVIPCLQRHSEGLGDQVTACVG